MSTATDMPSPFLFTDAAAAKVQDLIQEEGNRFRILSSEKLQGIAPGQFGVIYDEEAGICVGSGEITR